MGRGKDKQKRKSRRNLLIAGGIGASIVGLGGLAALKYRKGKIPSPNMGASKANYDIWDTHTPNMGKKSRNLEGVNQNLLYGSGELAKRTASKKPIPAFKNSTKINQEGIDTWNRNGGDFEKYINPWDTPSYSIIADKKVQQAGKAEATRLAKQIKSTGKFESTKNYGLRSAYQGIFGNRSPDNLRWY